MPQPPRPAAAAGGLAAVAAEPAATVGRGCSGASNTGAAELGDGPVDATLKAIRKLKHPSRSRKLKDFLD